MDFSSTALANTGAVAAIVAILNAAIVRWLLPKFLADLEKRLADLTMAVEVGRQAIQDLKLQRAEDTGALRAELTTGDNALRLSLRDQDTTLRTLWHAEADAFNKAVNSVAAKGEENSRSIDDIKEQIDAMEKKADLRHEAQTNDIHKLDKTVDRLANSVDNLASVVKSRGKAPDTEPQ
jgi:hypothetical protein